MQEKILSIIIPTYNMEKYLSNCLDSLIIPSIDKLDVIVVNDGSKDKSSEIAHSYANRFPHSVRVIDKKNGNYGSCINAALPTVKGKYVKILDADDTFDTQNLEEFVKILSEINVDLVITNFLLVDENGSIIKETKGEFLTKGNILGQEEFVEIVKDKMAQMHAFTFNSNVFKGIDYQQSEGISYTDSEWIFYPLINCQSFIYIDLILYKYLLGRNGQTMELKTYLQRLDQMIYIIDKFVDFYKDKQTNNKIANKEYYEEILFNFLKSLYSNAIYNKTPHYEKFLLLDKKVEKNLPELYKRLDRSTSFMNKFFPLLYWKKHNKQFNAPLLVLYRRYLKIKSKNS